MTDTYGYKALDGSGSNVTGVMEAASEDAVVSQLHAKGYLPLEIHKGGRSKELKRPSVNQWFQQMASWRISSADILLFTRNLRTLLVAGLPMDAALSALGKAGSNQRLNEIIAKIVLAVQEGSTFSEALGKHPNLFSRLYVSMIRAGEAGGVLSDVLERLEDHIARVQELKEELRSSMTYPVFLVLTGGVSILILLIFVLPRFATIFEDMDVTLPLTTQLILQLSTMLRAHGWLMALLFLAGAVITVRWLRSPSGRHQLDRLALALPLVRSLILNIETARLTRTLGALLQSGVPVIEALTLANDTISNQIIADRIEKTHHRVKEGDRLAASLESCNVLPAIALQMIAVGEESGRLDQMLLQVADHQEQVVRRKMKRITALLEPLMILVMGIVIAVVVLSMLSAIFSINEIPI